MNNCSFDNPQMSGGTTTESTNGYITGSLEKVDGTPARQTIVKLIESNYDPVKDGPVPDSLVDTTDERGKFAFHVAGGKTFNIEGRQCSSGEGILISGVLVQTNDTVIVPSGSIRKTGSIKIMHPMDIDTTDTYIYIRGTTIYATVNGTSDFVLLESVPAGTTPSLYYSGNSSSAVPKVIADSVSIAPGATTVIAYQAWRYSAKLFLNTTASGAGVDGMVTNFPLLIRLNESNFDFAQAKAEGGDLRFTKSSGTTLPYEIERWDVTAHQAEVWVKVDTVYGNDSTHFIKMFWGNPEAAGISNSESVFDTADGFSGVWHLTGAGNSTARDATGHHYDGTPSDTAPQSTAGIIGGAVQFDGKSNGLLMKNTANSPLNFPRPGTYTFSAWVIVDSVYIGDEFIAGKGINQFALRIKGNQSIPSNMFALQEYYDSPVNGTDMRCSPVVVQQWKYVVGIRDTLKSRLFIDGICADSTGTLYPVMSDYKDSVDFSIGRCIPPDTINYLPFKGKIDEVRVAGVAFSEDWVKLSFMNQKPVDKLIRFEK
jgi:hypothetical protein